MPKRVSSHFKSYHVSKKPKTENFQEVKVQAIHGHYQNALNALSSQQWNTAFYEFKKLLGQDPNFIIPGEYKHKFNQNGSSEVFNNQCRDISHYKHTSSMFIKLANSCIDSSLKEEYWKQAYKIYQEIVKNFPWLLNSSNRPCSILYNCGTALLELADETFSEKDKEYVANQHIKVGCNYLVQNKSPDASKFFTQATKLAPQNGTILSDIMDAYLKFWDKSTYSYTIKQFEEDAIAVLGYLDLELKQQIELKSKIEGKELNSESKIGEINYNKGLVNLIWAEKVINCFNDALTYVQRAVDAFDKAKCNATESKIAQINYNTALAYLILVESLSEIDSSKDDNQKSPLYLILARSRFEEAQEFFSKQKSQDSKSCSAWYNHGSSLLQLAICEKSAGNFKEVASYATEALSNFVHASELGVDKYVNIFIDAAAALLILSDCAKKNKDYKQVREYSIKALRVADEILKVDDKLWKGRYYEATAFSNLITCDMEDGIQDTAGLQESIDVCSKILRINQFSKFEPRNCYVRDIKLSNELKMWLQKMWLQNKDLHSLIYMDSELKRIEQLNKSLEKQAYNLWGKNKKIISGFKEIINELREDKLLTQTEIVDIVYKVDDRLPTLLGSDIAEDI